MISQYQLNLVNPLVFLKKAINPVFCNEDRVLSLDTLAESNSLTWHSTQCLLLYVCVLSNLICSTLTKSISAYWNIHRTYVLQPDVSSLSAIASDSANSLQHSVDYLHCLTRLALVYLVFLLLYIFHCIVFTILFLFCAWLL